MKKNLFLRLCLILVVSLIISSCRTDHLTENETYNNSSKFQLTSKRISLNEAKHNTQLITELSEAKNEFKKLSRSNANGKTVNFGDSISVNTESVIYMENGPNYHTYTFSIQRNNPLPEAPVENLVFTPLPEGGYKAYLVTYNLTEAEKNTILNGGNVSVTNKSVVTPLEGNFSSVLGRVECSEYIYDYYTWCGEGKHNNGEICNSKDGVYSQHVVIIGIKCSGGNPMLPGTNPPEDGSGSGEAGGAVPCSANGVYLNPQDPVSSGCSGGISTQPNLEFTPVKTPCQKIKEQRADTEFNNKITDLQGKTGLTKETGYIQKWGGDYEYKDNAGATDDANTLTLPQVTSTDHIYIKAYMHTHPDDFVMSDGNIKKGIKMFSPADVIYFMDLIQNAQNRGFSLSDPYAVMVTSKGNYQIRFTGNKYQIKTFTDQDKEYHREAFSRGMKDYLDNPKQLELGFLKYIQKEMILYGITLYRMNTDGTTTEIKLNADKTDTVENTCP